MSILKIRDGSDFVSIPALVGPQGPRGEKGETGLQGINGKDGTNIEVSNTEPEDTNVEVWINPSATSEVEDLQLSVNNLWKTIYPVNSIFTSTENVDPGTFLGGTWGLIYSDVERIYVGSQIIYPGASGSSLVSKTSVIGTYDYELINGPFVQIEIPEGYHKEYRLSFIGTTNNDTQIICYINNIETEAVRTYSANTYRKSTASNYFKQSDITLATTHGYAKQGVNLYYSITGTTTSWQFWDVTIHGYIASDEIYYKWKRIS